MDNLKKKISDYIFYVSQIFKNWIQVLIYTKKKSVGR